MAVWMHGKSTLRHCLIMLVECDFLKRYCASVIYGKKTSTRWLASVPSFFYMLNLFFQMKSTL